MSTVTWYKPREVAERWGISVDEVWRMLRARELGHMVVNPTAKRPTYRISEKHLQQYERRQDRGAW